MELVVIVVLFLLAIWFILFKSKKDASDISSSVPYKLEVASTYEPEVENKPSTVSKSSTRQLNEKPVKSNRRQKSTTKATEKAPAKAPVKATEKAPAKAPVKATEKAPAKTRISKPKMTVAK